MEIREVKAKFIQELLQLGKRDLIYRTGLDSECEKDKWGYMAKEQGGGQWIKND